jgi:hypothetical protein
VNFFRQRGSMFLLVAAVATSIETILGKAVPDPFRLQFCDNVSPRAATDTWRSVVDISLAFVAQLESALERNLENRERVTEATGRFRALVEATRAANATIFDEFSARVCEA